MNIIGFLVSLVLFVGGLYIMGSAFEVHGAEGAVFGLGLLCSALGFFIPVHIMKRIDG